MYVNTPFSGTSKCKCVLLHTENHPLRLHFKGCLFGSDRLVYSTLKKVHDGFVSYRSLPTPRPDDPTLRRPTTPSSPLQGTPHRPVPRAVGPCLVDSAFRRRGNGVGLRCHQGGTRVRDLRWTGHAVRVNRPIVLVTTVVV